MLGQLARLAKEVEKAKGQLKLTGLGPVLRDTFRISHFESLFAIYDDQASALKAFRRHPTRPLDKAAHRGCNEFSSVPVAQLDRALASGAKG